VPPRARHAGFPGYAAESEPPSPLAWDWATQRLREARSYWVATTMASGAPHAMPVWGVWQDDAVWFSTGARSVKARNLARDRRVVVHLESADEAVILHGSVERPSAQIADAVLDEYERKYELRPDAAPDAWFRLRPSRAYAWRERDYPRSMTRFDF
jgi:hypothetical protein